MTSGQEEKDTSERTHEKNPSTSSSSRPFSDRFGFGYLRDTLEWITGKGKRKEKPEGYGDISVDDGSKMYLNPMFMQRSIKNHQLQQIIPLPPEIELHEWLASQIIPFFNHINLLYGTVCEYCTQISCPVMSAPNNMIYYWIDERGRKSKCSAVEYIDRVTASIEKLVRDDAVFPYKHALPFPANFDVLIRRIQRQLLHVLAHMYHAHYDTHIQLGTHVYLNGLFVHFILFSQHFNLVEPRELDVLRDLIDCLLSENEVLEERSNHTKPSSHILHGSGEPEASLADSDLDVVPNQENVNPSCDRKSISPLKSIESTAPLNVKTLLLENSVGSSII